MPLINAHTHISSKRRGHVYNQVLIYIYALCMLAAKTAYFVYASSKDCTDLSETSLLVDEIHIKISFDHAVHDLQLKC